MRKIFITGSSRGIGREIAKFFKFEVPILIGHSRKSFLREIYKTNSIKKLDKITKEITNLLTQLGADIIRSH